MDVTEVVQEIQLIVAPAVMISSAALLLLGFQTKFSNLASRFRSLNHELRELVKKDLQEPWEKGRRASLASQVAQLLVRATRVKNAILLTYGAIILFILCSVFIFFHTYGLFLPAAWVIGSFLCGLLLELAAAAVMITEVALAFQVIEIESRS